MKIRNWRDACPSVGHNGKIIWTLFSQQGRDDRPEGEACLQGLQSLTLHRLQGGGEGDYHEHEEKEQVYYFLSGRAQMKIDGQVHEVREGDAVCVPPRVKHQLVNPGDEWVEHLIITGKPLTAAD